MVMHPKWPGKPPDHPADIVLADAGCRRPANPTAILAAHSRKPAELGDSYHPGSLGTLVALSGERRDRRPSHDEQTEHDHDRVTRASGRHSLANGNEPGASGTPPPEEQRADRPTTRRASRFLERETGVEPATLGLGSQDSQPRKSLLLFHLRRFAFQAGCRRRFQDVAELRVRKMECLGGARCSRRVGRFASAFPWGEQGALLPRGSKLHSKVRVGRRGSVSDEVFGRDNHLGVTIRAAR